ncbi:AHH domain-containing protein [Novosphingobium sp.]|uniref:AHH domain-containing protein n=1 Tax=Novosphingobium sp. TaxID=1874826 RepID=UPI00286DB33E|nr:AHH domain-containing protein [Novosphingobium sp.]
MAIGLTIRAGEPQGIRQVRRPETASGSLANQGTGETRTKELRFRAVNRYGCSDYNAGLQRHHLLPLQLLSMRCFGQFFESVGLDRIGFDDFRRNGLLLPCSDRTATMMALPMHRGPHHRYNALAIDRVARIERDWRAGGRSDVAAKDALFRLDLLQSALRRRLLDPSRHPIPLNSRDPALHKPDFSDLDAMADLLWAATEGP